MSTHSRDLSWRVTPIRTAILNVLGAADKPLSAKEVLAGLRKTGQSVDRVTVYRDLSLFLSHGTIRGVEFGDDKKRYEIAGTNHHHHAVCTSCKQVEDFALPQTIEKAGNRIVSQKGFTITGHSFEFFGLCKKCQPRS